MTNGSVVHSNITSLPLDILTSLMDYLHPLDLITLRKTCRALHDASRQRIVWIKVLMEMCIANDVFLPTFELDDMTTEDLSQAATAPSRWLTVVRERYRQQVTVKQGCSGMILKPPAVNSTPIDLGLLPHDEVQSVFLVPGGRFIVFLTLHSLQVWDSGLVGKDKVTARRVTSVKMNQQYNIGLSAQPTKDGMGLRLVVSSFPKDTAALTRNSERNGRKQISVYEIYLLEDQPTLNDIAHLGVNMTSAGIVPRLAGDLIVFLDGHVVKVWDFVNDLRAEWNTHKDFSKDIFVTSDSVLLLNHQETLVWRIPALKPLDQEPSPTTAENVFSFPSLLGSGTTKMVHRGLLSDWYWNKRESFLDVFSQASPGSKAYTISRFKLTSASASSQLSASSTSESLPVCGPSLSFKHGLDSSLEIINPTLKYRYCEGDLVACSVSKNGVLGYVSILGREPESFVHVGIQLKHAMDCVVNYSVCPLSGRFCYATDENEIEIADLFSGV